MFTVLGSQGYVGRALADALRAAGEEVFAPGRDLAGVFDRPLGHLVYCIGLTSDFRTRPFDTVEAHVTIPARLLRTAVFDSFTYLSSTRVKSGALGQGYRVDPAEPSDLYNLSKLMGEALCNAVPRAAVRVVRLSNVVGREDAQSDNFVFALLREAREGRIVLRSDPESAKDYVDLADVVALLPRIARTGRQRLYELGSGIQTSHRKIVDMIAQRTGCTVEVADRATLQAFAPVDISALRDEFAFSPRNPFAFLTETPEAARQTQGKP